MAPVDMTRSLPSRFGLIYALAVFLPSLVILLAGSFLTLDRTRSFENQNEGAKYGPIYKSPGKNPMKIWRFDGGVGGLLTGFLFGLYFASLLALVIANRTSSPPLPSGAFLAIWMTFSLFFAFAGARWDTVALIMTAILGGASVTIFLATAFHPSLVARLVLLGLLLIIGLLGTFLPIFTDRDLRRWTLRAAEACTGSLGLIIGISIFTAIPGWGSAWLRLVVKDNGEAWNTGKEKGLAVVFLLFAFIGTASDWYLAKRFGADPAQEWDSYLASLPSWNAQSEGTFQPPRSLWQRIFHKTAGNGSHLRRTGIEDTPMKEQSDDDEFTKGPIGFQDHLLSRQTPTLSLPPRVSKAFRLHNKQSWHTDEDSLKRSLVLPPLVEEADQPRRKPLTLPPLRRSLPPRSTSMSSEMTAIEPAFQAGSVSDRKDVEVAGISDEGDGYPPIRERRTAAPAPNPPASISHSFNSSSSREVHSIPEELQGVEVKESATPAPATDTDQFQSRGKSEETPQRTHPQDSPAPKAPPPPDYPPPPSLIRAFERIEKARVDAHARGARLKPPSATTTTTTTLFSSSAAARAGPRPNASTSAPASPPRGEGVGAAADTGGLFDEEEWETFWKDVRVKATVARQ